MKAGFARASITPPLGTRMMGVGNRDLDHGCDAIHDDIFVRAAYFEHDGEAALIMSFDLCFIGREDADRFKGAIGRHLDLLPRQILMSATHSHVSPSVGTWYAAEYWPTDRLYLRQLEAAVIEAALRATESAQDATLWVGKSRSSLPMNRRGQVNGETLNTPNPDGPVIDVLPVCLVRDGQDRPLALLFSIATHPSLVRGFEISAEFPGVATDKLDEYLGTTASLFLQGTGGDSKPVTIAEGTSGWNWNASWPEMERTGVLLAEETIAAIETGLTQVQPQIRTALFDTHWPLQPAFERSEYERIADNSEDTQQRLWAARQIERLDRDGVLPSTAPVLIQGIQLGDGLRLIAIEGEPLSPYGQMILDAYPDGVTFPLGYANGEAMYLVTTPMLEEGGMEPNSYWEYGHPSPLAPGMESAMEEALVELKRRGFS